MVATHKNYWSPITPNLLIIRPTSNLPVFWSNNTLILLMPSLPDNFPSMLRTHDIQVMLSMCNIIISQSPINNRNTGNVINLRSLSNYLYENGWAAILSIHQKVNLINKSNLYHLHLLPGFIIYINFSCTEIALPWLLKSTLRSCLIKGRQVIRISPLSQIVQSAQGVCTTTPFSYSKLDGVVALCYWHSFATTPSVVVLY